MGEGSLGLTLVGIHTLLKCGEKADRSRSRRSGTGADSTHGHRKCAHHHGDADDSHKRRCPLRHVFSLADAVRESAWMVTPDSVFFDCRPLAAVLDTLVFGRTQNVTNRN